MINKLENQGKPIKQTDDQRNEETNVDLKSRIIFQFEQFFTSKYLTFILNSYVFLH